MLAFNNKILTISNKGLEYTPPSPPPTPPEPYDVLLTLPVSTYTGSAFSPTTILSGRTWDTDKNFIVYKGTVLCSGAGEDWMSSYVCLQNPNSNLAQMHIMMGKFVDNYSGDYGTWSANECAFTAFDYSSYYGRGYQGTTEAGTDGELTRAPAYNYALGYTAVPTIYMTDTPINFKMIFNKSTKVIYCYFDDKYVCNIGTSRYGDTTTWPIHTGCTSASFGMTVYACDSLEVAEAI